MVAYMPNSNHRHERILLRLEAVHGVLVAYAGTRERFTQRSKVPDMAKWQVYELLKDGMSPEDVGAALRMRYVVDFSQSGPSTLLTLVLQQANSEYINSDHLINYKPSAPDQNRN